MIKNISYIYLHYILNFPKYVIMLLVIILIGISSNISNFKLDASADSLILENDMDLETYRNDPIAYRLIGDSYVNLNNYQDAIINYRKAAELYNYEDLLSLYKLGESYFNIEDYNNAAKYFKSALKINYDHAQTHAYLASTYTILKKYREAKKECDILYMLDRESYNNIDYCIN